MLTLRPMGQKPRYPRDLQLEKWNRLAPRIGYRPGFLHLGVECSADLTLGVFDHGAIVVKACGQLALLGDPYRRAQDDGDLYAFAERFGLQVDYLGRGLWHSKSRCVVFTVADPVRALSLIQSRFRQGMPETFVVYGHPRKFMPPGTNMPAVRRLYQEAQRLQAIEDARRFQERFARALLAPRAMAV